MSPFARGLIFNWYNQTMKKFTIREVEKEVIGQLWIQVEPERVARAINYLLEILGEQWLKELIPIGNGYNTAAVLESVWLADILRIVDGKKGFESLKGRIKKFDQSAEAELGALYIIADPAEDMSFEIAPRVNVRGGTRFPEFRVKYADGQDLIVEVTMPNDSYSKSSTVNELMGKIQQKTAETNGIKIFAVGTEYNDEESSASIFVSGPGADGESIKESKRYSKERLLKFFDEKLKQMPETQPGLIMINVLKEPEAMKLWPVDAKSIFWQDIYSRISGVCFFDLVQYPDKNGMVLKLEVALVLNPKAKFELPAKAVDVINSKNGRIVC